MQLSTLLLLASFSALAISVKDSRGFRTLGCDVRAVYEFPNETYVENLAVRSNGQIIMSAVTEPNLYMIDPLIGGVPAIVYTFPEVIGLSGIAEYKPDVFAVITGNYTLATANAVQGSWSVWSVDLNGISLGPNNTLTSLPKVEKITTIAEAIFLNGMSILSESDGTVLIGDVAAGDIWRLSISSGESEIAIQNNFTAPALAPPFSNAGVDGLRIRDGFLSQTPGNPRTPQTAHLRHHIGP
ncbi:hypothetical protein B7463_g582, partial [Scytalidium lignicola]